MRRLLHMFTALTIALVASTGAPATAGADDSPTTSTTTWSVTPSSADAPDGRRFLELDVDPGDTALDYIAVRNLGTEATTFALTAADGYLTDKGKFNMLTSDQESSGAGTWITLPSTVAVNPGETAIVPVELTIPDDAAPGDHVAGIAASITTAAQAGSGLGVESRVGFRAIFHVSGELRTSVDLQSLRLAFHDQLNPFLPGSATLSATFINDGNTTISITPKISVAGPFGLAPREETLAQFELLPGATRTVKKALPGVWPLGLISANITTAGDPTFSSSTTSLAFPWSQAILLAGVSGVFVWYRAGSRKRLATLLEAARDEGARERAHQ